MTTPRLRAKIGVLMKKLSERKKRWIERTVANDRSNKRLLYNRFYLFALLVLCQIAGFVYLQYLITYHTPIGVILQAVVNILAIVCVLYLLNKNDRPSSKLNWILIILIFPVFGVPFYIWFGEGRPVRKVKKKLSQASKDMAIELREIYGDRNITPPRTREEGVSHYLFKCAGYPAYGDGSVTYYDCGEKLFLAIKEELKKAKKFILVEYFIIAHGKMWGEILQILLKKAEEGVQIRIIYDDFGCMTTLPPDYDRYLEALHENIRAMTFNEVIPVFALRMNNRDHRKILVVDGETGFTGGVNLADEYINEIRRFGYWKDSGVKITGVAVNSFTRMFFSIWNAFREDKERLAEYIKIPVNADMVPSNDAQTGERGLVIQPYDDSPLDDRSVGEHVYMDMINRATRYVYIFTPYLLLDDAVRTGLVRAAERGVDVRVVTPGIPDKKMTYRLTRANYGVLLKAGVKIYEYSPGFLHAKSLVCDDESAVVGTINFDYRSLYLHFEDGVYFSHCDAVMEVKRDAEETFPLCRERTLESNKRGLLGRLADSLLRVFETLM